MDLILLNNHSKFCGNKKDSVFSSIDIASNTGTIYRVYESRRDSYLKTKSKPAQRRQGKDNNDDGIDLFEDTLNEPEDEKHYLTTSQGMNEEIAHAPRHLFFPVIDGERARVLLLLVITRGRSLIKTTKTIRIAQGNVASTRSLRNIPRGRPASS